MITHAGQLVARFPADRYPRGDMGAPHLSIVIPALNEGAVIAGTLERIRAYAAGASRSCEIVVVDDGSTDDTAGVVRGQPPDLIAVRMLVNPANRGKGHSVARGMLAATGDFVLLCDADLSTPIDEVEKLLPWLGRGNDVVIGSRDMPDSRLDPPQPLVRRVMAWTFRALRRRLLLPELRDTQCGFKLFMQPAARAIFSRLTVDGWLFDCEALGLAERLGYRIKEVGVIWRNRPHSRVKPVREALNALPALLRIRRRLAAFVP
jgi:dolichyl-phosphate beta-glucosyltransferase